jgi:hypothetical protein
MVPKPKLKPVRSAASRAPIRSESGDWLVQKPASRPLDINRSSKMHRTAGEQGIFGDHCELKPGRIYGESLCMLTEDRVVKKAACVTMF